MVWQRLTRRWKKNDRRQESKKKRQRRLSMESLAKRELLASDFGAITGTAYNDANANGIFDAGEVALANVNIALSGQATANTTTDANGVYRFDGLEAGNYQVNQNPPPPAGFQPQPGQSPRNITITAADAQGQSLITIDDFNTATQSVDAVSTGTNPNSSSITDGTGGVLGGTRDIFVNVSSATGSATVSANPGSNPGFLEINPSATAAAEYLITYDGDSDATVLDATGLGGIDLTQGGAATALQAILGFDIDPGSGANGTLAVTFFTDATNSSTYTFPLPDTAGAPSAELILRYAGVSEIINGALVTNAVVTQGAGGPVDFTNIGAIQFAIDSDGETAVDGIIDIQRVIGPTDLTANFANDQITPEIDIQKTTNGIQADTGNGPNLAVGSTATFDYTVTNPGTTALDITSIVDDPGTPANNGDDFTPTFIGGDTNNNGIMETTETWTYQATRTVTAGQYNNTITVVANPVDANGNDLANVADVNDNDPSAHFGVTPIIALQKLTNGVDADTATGPSLVVGETATFTYNVTNPGDVALDTVVVRDDNGTPADNTDDFDATFVAANSDANNNGRLDPGETFQFTATRVVTDGQYTNNAVVTGNPVDANGQDLAGVADVTDADPSNHIGITPQIALQKLTNGQDADTATGPTLVVGETATFTYNVTNPGTVSLDGIVVRDDNGTPADATDDFDATIVAANSDANNNGRLDPGETFQFTATRVVTEGQYTNNADVTGNPVDANGVDIAGAANVTDADPSNHIGVTPQIALQKLTNGQDADTATGPTLVVGETATFTYNVTNPGTVALDGVVVRDDNGTPADATDDFDATFVAAASDANNNGRLDPGETFQFTATRVVTAGQYTNVANVTGNPVDAAGVDLAGVANVNDTDPSNHIGVAPQIALQKLTNGQDADTATGPSLVVGSTATFTYNVTNPGTVALDAITVRDDNGTPANTADDFNATLVAAASDANNNGRLDPGETFQFTATRTVTAGQYTNNAVVTGNPVDDTGADIAGAADVTDNDPSNHIGVTPQIALQKLTNGQDADTATGPSLAVGSTATFTYNVTNPSTTSLNNITVRDDNGTPADTSDDFDATFVAANSDANNNGRLDPGETFQFTATRTVTAGQYTNNAVTTGNPVDAAGVDIVGAADVTDADPSNHIGVASTINIEKATNGQDSDAPTGQRLDVGSTATFSYVVTNTGLALSNVVVTDDNGTPGVTTDDFNPTFNGGDTNNNGQLDQGESWNYSATRVVTLGQYTNIATVTGDNPGGGAQLTDTDASNHLGIAPGGQLSKRDFLASTT